MDLVEHLRTLCEVAAQGSFTRAADALGVPQPVASRRVGALERRLGGRLLVRGRDGVVPTDLGHAVLAHAGAVVARTDHLLEVARTFQHGVVVAVPPGADPRGLVAARTAARAVGVTVTFAELDPAGRVERLRDGTATAAVLPAPADEADLAGDLGVALADSGARSGPVHLDALRRQRGGAGPLRVVRLLAEDDVPWVRDEISRSAARSGLAPAQVQVTTERTGAVADVIELGDLMVCTRNEAEQHRLGWRRLGGVSVQRTYRIAAARDDPAARPEVLAALVAPLAGALGLRPSRQPPVEVWSA